MKKPRSDDRGTFAGRATIAGCFRPAPSARLRPRRMEHQREAVHAIAQAGRLRAVVEDVAEMAAAAAAMHLGAQHAEGTVLGGADGVFERLVEARPAGPAFELGIGGEQRQVATGAGEDALAMLLEERAGAGALGALLAQDLVLLRRQLRAPLGVGLLDLEFLAGAGGREPEPTEGGKTKQARDRSQQNTAIKHWVLRDCSPENTGLPQRSYTVPLILFSTLCKRH